MRRLLRPLLFASCLLAVALGLDAFWIEPGRLVVNRQELRLADWPPALSGLRVALVSDLHVGAPHWGAAELGGLVARVNQEHPDIVLLAGDYLINQVLFGKHVAAEEMAGKLAALRAPLGVFAVLGNHDWWNDPVRVRTALEQNGVRVLDDEAVRVSFRGAEFCLLGLRDEYYRQKSAKHELDLAIPGLPLIVLIHEPDLFADMDDRASLTLAGHTHGGQVVLPLLGALIVPSRYGQRYAAGHIVESGRHMFVTTGVGTSTLPVRFGVPPEIALLTLR